MIMGGQTDIDIVHKCRVVGLEFDPAFLDATFLKPKHGLSGMREFTGVPDRPFFGGIIKPKTGIPPHDLLDMTKELVDGGVNFIKEDEILSNPTICRLQDRVPLISNYIRDTKVVYCFCINADPVYLLPRARFVAANGGTGVHVNIWSGLGALQEYTGSRSRSVYTLSEERRQSYFASRQRLWNFVACLMPTGGILWS